MLDASIHHSLHFPNKVPVLFKLHHYPKFPIVRQQSHYCYKLPSRIATALPEVANVAASRLREFRVNGRATEGGETVAPRSPKQQLEHCAATLARWLRKQLRGEGETQSAEDLDEWAARDTQVVDKQIEEYERLLQRVPDEWRKYRQRRTNLLAEYLPKAAMGRPSKDQEAAEAERLHKEGLSWKQIAIKLGATPETVHSEADRVRKLVKARQRVPPGKKSR